MKFMAKFKKLMQEDPKRKFFGLFSAEDIIKINSTNPATPQDIENSANAIKAHNIMGRLHEIKNENQEAENTKQHRHGPHSSI